MRLSAQVLLALALVSIATLLPASGPPPEIDVLCVLCGELGTPDVIANVLLYLPLGIALARGGLRPWQVAAATLVISGGIEVAQTWIPGRSPTVRDVVINVGGATLGALLVRHLARWLLPSARSTVLAGLAAIAPAVAIASSAAFRSYAMTDGEVWVMLAPRHAHLAPWDGVVMEVVVAGRRTFSGRQINPARVREALSEGARVEVRGLAGPPTPRLGSIVSIADERGRRLFLIGPDRDDLLVFTRRRAAAARMAEPPTRFRGALAGLTPGDSFQIATWGPPTRVCASVNGVAQCASTAAAGSLWQLVRPLDAASPSAQRAMHMLTLAVLLFPLGVLAPSVHRNHRLLLLIVAASTIPLAAHTSGVAPPSLLEWTGIALGVGLGAALNRRIRPRP